MNREELLQACFGDAVLPRGKRMVEVTEGADVIAHLDVDYRRVVIRRVTAPAGDQIQAASETVQVVAISNVCTDPAHRGKGYATQAVEEALREARTHHLVEFAALFSDSEEFYGRLGFVNPEGAPKAFLVCSLRGAEWPAGSIDTRGEW